MRRIGVELSEDQAERLESVAERLGVRPEELARASIADLLNQPRQDFEAAAEYVLKKNEELYRRLA